MQQVVKTVKDVTPPINDSVTPGPISEASSLHILSELAMWCCGLLKCLNRTQLKVWSELVPCLPCGEGYGAFQSWKW